MVVLAVLAMLAANSPLAEIYRAFITYPLTEHMSLKLFVKDVLMVIFFLMIGLELKHEMNEGALARRDQMALPLFCALGGMVGPALIYVWLNHADPAAVRGWAIPSATDIAFALAVLNIFGRGVASTAKVFLLAVAVFDDLGAIALIALFYNSGIAPVPLLAALALVGVLAALARARVGALWAYMLAGAALAACFHYCGIHTTLAGVITGLAVPLHVPGGASPQHRAANALQPYVNFFIVPLFAFVSAGVSLAVLPLSALLEPVPLGIMLGLFAGKQLGVFGTAALLIKLKLARMPQGSNWRQLYAVCVLTGIGFTMSLFITQLAFSDRGLQELATLGVLLGSLFSAVLGALLLRGALSKKHHSKK